jgi:hypothetical protein
MKMLIRNLLVTSAFVLGANGLMAQTNDSWVDQLYQARIGRIPQQEARQRAEEGSTAYRAEPARKAVPANTWFEDFLRTKLGRFA